MAKYNFFMKYVLLYRTEIPLLTKTYYEQILKIHTRYHTRNHVLNRKLCTKPSIVHHEDPSLLSS